MALVRGVTREYYEHLHTYQYIPNVYIVYYICRYLCNSDDIITFYHVLTNWDAPQSMERACVEIFNFVVHMQHKIIYVYVVDMIFRPSPSVQLALIKADFAI